MEGLSPAEGVGAGYPEPVPDRRSEVLARLTVLKTTPGGPNFLLRRVLAVAMIVVAIFGAIRIGGAISSLAGGGGDDSSGTVVAPEEGSTTASAASPTGSASPEAPTLPECAKGNRRATAATPDEWAETLLDTTFRLPAAYTLTDLVPVSQAGFENLPDLEVREVVVQDLAELRQAAADAGTPIDLVAAYRSFLEQKDLYTRRVTELGQEEADKRTARAGHSEHQLGTALDFRTFGELDVDQRWDSTPAGMWMLQNAWKYGFIQGYPKNAIRLTCYAYEPWHYRYFGRALARDIHDAGLTVREYLWARQHPQA